MADKSRRQKPDKPPAFGEQLFAAETLKLYETEMKPKLIDKPELPAACLDGLADEHIEQMLATAEYITRLYVTSFRESARLLAQLHDEVPEGNWLAFLDSGALPFNRRTAQDLCSAWSWLKDTDLTDQQLAKAFRSKRALAKVAIAEDDVREVIEAKVRAGETITEAAVNSVRRKSIPVAPTLEADPIDVEVVDTRDAEIEQLRIENADQQSRIAELEAELEALKAAKPEPPADVKKLQKALDRKTKSIKARDRRIRELQRFVPNRCLDKLKVAVEVDPDLQGAPIPRCERTTRYNAEMDHRQLEDDAEELLTTISRQRGYMANVTLRHLSRTFAGAALDLWQEYQEIGGESHKVTAIDEREQYWLIEASDVTVVDVSANASGAEPA